MDRESDSGAQLGTIVRCTDVALFSAAPRDEILAGLLHPVVAENESDGCALRVTLRTYFAASRYATAAADILGISRQTVNSRPRAVERTLGRRIDQCAPEPRPPCASKTSAQLDRLTGPVGTVCAVADLGARRL